MNDERLARMARHAERLAAHGHLRGDVTVDEARDVLWLYSAPDLYQLLVRERGWDVPRYGAWVGAAYVAALLPGGPQDTDPGCRAHRSCSQPRGSSRDPGRHATSDDDPS